jgi:hypothetical protein
MTITFTIEDLCDVKPTGGKMSAKDVKNLLNKSYDDKPSSLEGYEIDKELSGKRAQVYKKKGTDEAVVVHRGSQGIHDWGNNLKYVLGMDVSKSKRYKHAKDVQKKAEAKYGADKTTTLGHSLGAKLASDYGKNSKEVITLNKPVLLTEKTKANPKETTVRTTGDLVSAFLPTKSKDILTIPSKTFNPLAEHSPDVLERLPDDVMIGKGHVSKLSKKHLKDIIKKLPGKKGFKMTGKSKKELVDYTCDACGIH